jgi:hypothetical protein
VLLNCLVVCTTGAHAQDSTDVEITVTKSESVKISDVDDWLVGIWGPSDSITRRQGVFDYMCVHSSTGLYRLDFSSTNGGAGLTLRSSANDTMGYLVVVYSYSENSSRAFPDLRQEFSTPFSLNRRLASPTVSCVGQGFANANLYMAAAVNPADFNAAPPGSYQDTIIMTVSAE